MRRKIVGILICMLFIASVFGVNTIGKKNFGKTIYVDDDNILGPWDGSEENPFKSILEAYDFSSDDDTIYVNSGTYWETFSVEKSLKFIGEDKNSTIINALVIDKYIFNILTNNVLISGFTLQNANATNSDAILIGKEGKYPNNCSILDNIIQKSYFGVRILGASSNNTISKNIIFSNYDGINLMQYGIVIAYWNNTISNNYIYCNEDCGLIINTNNNNIFENSIIFNKRYGIFIVAGKDNIIYHNNIGWNSKYYSYNARDNSINFWDNGETGNYWENFQGIDENGDGIGDVSYNISGDGNSCDRYPLIEPFGANNHAPDNPKIDGAIKVKRNIEYYYNISTTDLDGDLVFYLIKWDDGSSKIIGPYQSGEKVITNLSWHGDYQHGTHCTTYVTAIDKYGFSSDEILFEVEITRSKNYIYFSRLFIEKLLYRFSFFEKILKQILL